MIPICNQVFIAMPFAPGFEPVWRCIREACIQHSLYAYRVDQLPLPGDITRHIFDGIRESLFVIADLSGGNLNVAFEVGYASALGKKLILLADDLSSLPFDIRNLRVIPYALEAVTELHEQLSLAIGLAMAQVRDGH